jgi:hypothetical protein
VSSFKSFAPRLTGLLLTAAAISAFGQIGVFLVVGLMFLLIALIIVLAITGVFGSDRHKQAAQTVLAILLGRNRPRDPGPHSGESQQSQDAGSDDDGPHINGCAA